MQPLGTIACAGGSDPALQRCDGPRQHLTGVRGGSWVDVHDSSETLTAVWPEDGIIQCGEGLLHHRLRYGSFTPGVPGQAGVQWCLQPPADPLHRLAQRKPLRDRQAPGPARMGGVDQHGPACGQMRLDGAVQLLFHLRPAALNARIAVELFPDHIGGEDLGLQQGRELCGDAALAAGRSTDQQVAAQGSGHQYRRWPRSFARRLCSTARSSQKLAGAL